MCSKLDCQKSFKLKHISYKSQSVTLDTTPCRMTGVTLHGVVSPDFNRMVKGEDCTAQMSTFGSESPASHFTKVAKVDGTQLGVKRL